MGVETHLIKYKETKNSSFPAHTKKRVRYKGFLLIKQDNLEVQNSPNRCSNTTIFY